MSALPIAALRNLFPGVETLLPVLMEQFNMKPRILRTPEEFNEAVQTMAEAESVSGRHVAALDCNIEGQRFTFLVVIGPGAIHPPVTLPVPASVVEK